MQFVSGIEGELADVPAKACSKGSVPWNTNSTQVDWYGMRNDSILHVFLEKKFQIKEIILWSKIS